MTFYIIISGAWYLAAGTWALLAVVAVKPRFHNLIDTWAKEHNIEWVHHILYHAPASGKIEQYNGDRGNWTAVYLAWSLEGPFSCGVAEGWRTASANHHHSSALTAIWHQSWFPCINWFVDWRAKGWSAGLAHPLTAPYDQCESLLESGD